VNKNRLMVVALCMLTTAGLAAGCNSKDATGGPPPVATSSAAAPSPSVPSPKDTFLASTKALDETTYHFQVKQGAQTYSGKIDPANKASVATATAKNLTGTVVMDFTVIGTDVWLKLDLGAGLNKQFGINKSKWMTIDATKLTNKDVLPSVTSGTSTEDELNAGLVTVERVDDTSFKGTLDVTKMDDFAPEQEILAKAGDKAKAVPFTATLDTKGRLTQIKTDSRGLDPAFAIDMTFTNFGGAVNITKPAGAIPAPASLYTVLNG
jgi:hypothetical protein